MLQYVPFMGWKFVVNINISPLCLRSNDLYGFAMFVLKDAF
jgi:hypothetical protein